MQKPPAGRKHGQVGESKNTRQGDRGQRDRGQDANCALCSNRRTRKKMGTVGNVDDEDILYLYTLERSNLHILNVGEQHMSLRGILDVEFLKMRPELLKIMAHVAHSHDLKAHVVHLGASLLDVYSLQGKFSQTIQGQTTQGQTTEVPRMQKQTQKKVQNLHSVQLHVDALAVFVLAARYLGGAAVYASEKNKRCLQGMDFFPLSAFTESWIKHAAYLFPVAEVSGLFFQRAELKEALSTVAVVLDWRMNRATADRFLPMFMSKNMLDTQAGDLDAQELGNVTEWATFFCESGVMNNMSCYYGESILAAASIFTARRVLDIKPDWPEHLYELYGIKHVQDLHTCVAELLHTYNSNPKRQCPLVMQMPVILYTFEKNHMQRHPPLISMGSPACLSPACLSPACISPACISPAIVSPFRLSPVMLSASALSSSKLSNYAGHSPSCPRHAPRHAPRYSPGDSPGIFARAPTPSTYSPVCAVSQRGESPNLLCSETMWGGGAQCKSPHSAASLCCVGPTSPSTCPAPCGAALIE